MKSKLPKVTILALMACLPQAAAAGPPAATGPPAASGNRLIRDAALQLARQPSLEAKLRQRVSLFGQDLVGAGVYQQLVVGSQTMLRLELKLQLSDRLTSLQQISNGTSLWIRRDIDQTQRLEFINLRDVRAALASRDPATAVVLPQHWTALGGLHQLLYGLDQNFEFAAPVAGHIDDVPVWRLMGRWKKEVLARMQGPGAAANEQPPRLPAPLPELVTVNLRRDDQPPLFPHRIEYSRQVDAAEPQSPVRYQPIVAMDLFEVRRRPDLDPRHFAFQPGDQEIEDRTAEFLEQLGLAPPETPRTSAGTR